MLNQKVEELLVLISKDLDQYDIHSDSQRLSLIDGAGGIILFYYNLYKATGKAEYFFKAKSWAKKYLDSVYAMPESLNHSYSNGITGVGKILSLIVEYKLLEDDHDEIVKFLDDLDLFLCEELKCLLQLEIELDFLHGSIGLGAYLLDRYQYSASKMLIFDSLTALIHKLNDCAKDSRNLGMAHGICAYIIFLIRYDLLFKRSDVRMMIVSCVDTLLSFKKSKDDLAKGAGFFPSIVEDIEKIDFNIPLGWCYGDLTVCITLLKAGIYLDKQVYKDIASEVVTNTISRNTTDTAFIRDASFCHGSVGIVKGYLQLRDINNSQDYLSETIDNWVEKTIELCYHSGGIGGYKKFCGTEILNGIESDKYDSIVGMLDGTSGVGLVLTDYLYKNNINWERLFFWD